ncbi:MAG: SDR family NAD(P)-dependent oxidoreductase, partial [Phenylobacterium sp.]|nr:SDR family NAD(P)-dependent oxidoreductase [Phenylobacterium sp.]
MSGRKIAITGAFGVVGQAVAQAAASQGMQLALIDIAPSGPAPEGAFVQGSVDLSDAAQAKAALAAVGERLGGLDVLVNVAGGFVWQTVEEGDPTAFDRLFALNTKTCLNATRAALPLIRGSAAGRIVNVGANG